MIGRCEDAYAAACDLAPPGPLPDDLDAIGWLLEELRVSLFAQNLRTKVSVSEKRVMTRHRRGPPSARWLISRSAYHDR